MKQFLCWISKVIRLLLKYIEIYLAITLQQVVQMTWNKHTVPEQELDILNLNLLNQTCTTKPYNQNLPNQIKHSLTSLLNQSYQTKITGQSSQRLGL